MVYATKIFFGCEPKNHEGINFFNSYPVIGGFNLLAHKRSAETR